MTTFAALMEVFTDEYWMREAIKEAKKAFLLNEVPVGAVVVSNNRIIGKGHNLTERLHDVTAHAEMQAITAACNHLGAKYLEDCTLYVTLEPCLMCAGAIFWARPSKIVWAADDPKRGFSLFSNKIIHNKTEISKGLLSEESQNILKEFFKKLR